MWRDPKPPRKRRFLIEQRTDGFHVYEWGPERAFGFWWEWNYAGRGTTIFATEAEARQYVSDQLHPRIIAEIEG